MERIRKRVRELSRKNSSYRGGMFDLLIELDERENRLDRFKDCELKNKVKELCFDGYTSQKEISEYLNYLMDNYDNYRGDKETKGLWTFAYTTLYYEWLLKSYCRKYCYG